MIDILAALEPLPLSGDVYLHRTPIDDDPQWQIFQEREKEFWEYETARPTYAPDPVAHILPCLNHWQLEPGFFRGKIALEIGSGPFSFFSGFTGKWMNDLPETLVVSDTLMDFYRKFEVSQRLMPKDAVLLKAPGEDMPFADNTFEIIVTNNTIDHVADCRAFLQEIHRLLKPGGTLLFCVHTLPTWFKPLRPLLKRIDKNHPYHFTAADLYRLFQGEGYRLDKTSAINLMQEEEIPADAPLKKKLLYFFGFLIINNYYAVAVAEK